MKIQAANPSWRAILEAAAEGNLLFLQDAYYQTATTATVRTKNHQEEHEYDADDDGGGADADDADAGASIAADTVAVGPLLFETAVCSSGCFALHWVAGSCACPIQARNVINFLIHECGIDVNQRAKTKSLGRTALHYACRNGRFETARVLVHEFGADPNASAKSGVTPFQLACWRNQLDIAQWLVNECHVDARQTNDFDCGAMHWLGLCPPDELALVASSSSSSSSSDGCKDSDGQELVLTAIWLIEQCELDCRARQRQGHNAMHKAAWGGHLALCRYLHEVHGMWDDQPDDAGYYAVDLAEMAHKTKVSAAGVAASFKKNKSGDTSNHQSGDTSNHHNNKTTTTTTKSRHAQVATYLRRVCSRATLQSCLVLNITMEQANHANAEDARRLIRRAYHIAVRSCHPDKRKRIQQEGQKSSPPTRTTISTAADVADSTNSSVEATSTNTTESSCCDDAVDMESAMNDRFLQVTAAYRHLMMQIDEQERDYKTDDTNDDGGDNGGNSNRRCYCNQKAIPFLLPPPPPPPPPPPSDHSVAPDTSTHTVDEETYSISTTSDPATTTTTTPSSCSSSSSSVADDEAWLTQSRLRIVLQQYGRCGSRGDLNGGGGGGGGTTATTTGGVVEKGLDLSNLRKWWNRCWPDVPLPVDNNNNSNGEKQRNRNLKAWIKTQQAVVYMRRDDKGFIRLYIKEEENNTHRAWTTTATTVAVATN